MDLARFIQESNRIEGIERLVRPEELAAHHIFIGLSHPSIRDLEAFVTVCQPGARLRDAQGLDVMVGAHRPPFGGIVIRSRLEDLLINLEERHPYHNHVDYETLHPFTDCNGRSGRVLWLWQMMQFHTELPRGFLHEFYYQALQASRS